MCSQPSTNVSAVACGLVPVALRRRSGPRTSSSPTPVSGSGSSIARSTTGIAKPTESACAAASSWGRKEVSEEVSVRPKPLPTRAAGKACLMRCDEALGDRGAAVGDPAHPADVELREARVAQHGVVDRGHRDELVDAVLADRPEEAVEVERAGEDLDPARRARAPGSAGCCSRSRGTAGPRPASRSPGPRSGRSRGSGSAFSLLVRKLRVRGHRALGEAGRAAGVEDRRELVRPRGPRRLDGLAVGQRARRARRCSAAPESSTT